MPQGPLGFPRPFGVGPLVKGKDRTDHVIYHTTSADNESSIRDNGILTKRGGGETVEVEAAIERVRPPEYPSREDSVFFWETISPDKVSDRDVIAVAVRLSDVPCQVYQTNVFTTLDLVNAVRHSTDRDYINTLAEEVWEDTKEYNPNTDETVELWAPCDIPHIHDIIHP